MNEFENFIKEKKTIDLVKANVYSLLGVIPIAFLYIVPFYFLWKERFSFADFRTLNLYSSSLPSGLLEFILLILGIVLHELIHGLTWAIFAKNGFKSMKFGISLKMLTPYCHCKEPLKVKHYILGAIMPSIILGLLPAILAIIIGNIMLLLFGTVFTVLAFGDFMIIYLLKNENKNTFVLDHPTEAGCYVFREK